ncbi:ATP-binding protein [Streptococcus didelphis]|uniref:ATP-binding protein n=1 Tax=Streptococcus didelphis TaxID=102886 RepID=A0ABY9LG19_9STRE|nr:ATP-binding protein [Streptococcus didelphis]WMB27846.1 ATP-binding protein [Streptococcus didelphis]
MEFILLVGVHGVGKSYLLNELSESISLQKISISDLIRNSGKKIDRGNKLVYNIEENQELWKEELKALTFNDGALIVLDGHLSLLNQEGVINELPLSTFNGIKIKKSY